MKFRQEALDAAKDMLHVLCRAELEGGALRMNYWSQDSDDAEILGINGHWCGTACCVAGYAAVYWEYGDKEGFSEFDENVIDELGSDIARNWASTISGRPFDHIRKRIYEVCFGGSRPDSFPAQKAVSRYFISRQLAYKAYEDMQALPRKKRREVQQKMRRLEFV